jgi:Glutaredoxin and related proteins
MSNIIVYTTKTCAFCKEVVRFLGHKNKKYTEIDVTNDVDKRIELQKITNYTTIPVTKIGDEYIVGWQPLKLSAALNKA